MGRDVLDTTPFSVQFNPANHLFYAPLDKMALLRHDVPVRDRRHEAHGRAIATIA